MAQEVVTVIAKSGSSLTVKTAAKAVCAKCEKSGGCKKSIFTWWPQSSYQITNNTNLEIQTGDKLVIETTSKQVTQASVLVYLVPLIIFLLSIVIANSTTNNELIHILVGVTALATGFVLARWLSQSYMPKSSIEIIKKLPSTIIK